MGGNKVAHHLNAGLILQNLELDPFRANILLRSFEGNVFANDDVRNLVKQCRSAAHGAGGKRGIESTTTVSGGVLSAGILQAVHFGMMNDTVLLNALVVA